MQSEELDLGAELLLVRDGSEQEAVRALEKLTLLFHEVIRYGDMQPELVLRVTQATPVEGQGSGLDFVLSALQPARPVGVQWRACRLLQRFCRPTVFKEASNSTELAVLVVDCLRRANETEYKREADWRLQQWSAGVLVNLNSRANKKRLLQVNAIPQLVLALRSAKGYAAGKAAMALRNLSSDWQAKERIRDEPFLAQALALMCQVHDDAYAQTKALEAMRSLVQGPDLRCCLAPLRRLVRHGAEERIQSAARGLLGSVYRASIK